MFLMSDAFRALDARRFGHWDWSASTILYVSHGWNPAQHGAQSITGRRLVCALLEAGARVHVLASSGATPEMTSANYALTIVPSPPLPANKCRRAVEMIRCAVPESAGQWVSGAADAGVRLLAALPADTIIYSRSHPGSSNIVAWHLARMTGRPWVAHFSDPWPPKTLWWKRRRWSAPYKVPLYHFWHRRIVRDAGALTFTNPCQGTEIMGRAAARHQAKAFVIAHLASEPARHPRPPQYDVFHVVHTGNFYSGQTAEAIMRGLRMFIDRTPAAHGQTRFTQAGWSHGDLPQWAQRCGLGDVVRLAGRLAQREVLELLDSSSLLLAVDYARPHSTTLLSKLPDYVNAARPILAVTAPSSALARFFNDDGAGLTAHYASAEQVADSLEAVFDAWQRRRLDPFLPRRPAIDSYDPQRVLGELAAAFQVARGSKAGGRGPVSECLRETTAWQE